MTQFQRDIIRTRSYYSNNASYKIIRQKVAWENANYIWYSHIDHCLYIRDHDGRFKYR